MRMVTRRAVEKDWAANWKRDSKLKCIFFQKRYGDKILIFLSRAFGKSMRWYPERKGIERFLNSWFLLDGLF